MSDPTTGRPERATGQPHGRMFVVPRALLTTLEATLARQVELHQMGKIPSFAYDDMSDEKVKIQLTVFRQEGP